MEYNLQGLNRLITRLGMQVEVERLLYIGIEYTQIAEVFDSMFNPDSKKVVPSFDKRFYRGFERNPDGYCSFPVSDRYRVFQSYFGIGTSEVMNEREKSKAIAHLSINKGSVKYKRDFFF